MALNKVTSVSNWNPQDACIERLMDNAAYTSAHPDDTLVMVGPARHSSVANYSELQPVGMLQQMQVSQQRAVQPAQAIGSARTYFLAGKPTVNFSIGRLFAKGPNLHRALYKNIMNSATINGFNPKEPASASNNPDSVFNMDSEMFLVPFGLVVAFRDKSGGSLGSFYIESCMISSYIIGVATGQNMIMENVSGSADRIYPINLTEAAAVANFFNEGTAGNQVVGQDGEFTDFSTTRT